MSKTNSRQLREHLEFELRQSQFSPFEIELLNAETVQLQIGTNILELVEQLFLTLTSALLAPRIDELRSQQMCEAIKQVLVIRAICREATIAGSPTNRSRDPNRLADCSAAPQSHPVSKRPLSFITSKQLCSQSCGLRGKLDRHRCRARSRGSACEGTPLSETPENNGYQQRHNSNLVTIEAYCELRLLFRLQPSPRQVAGTGVLNLTWGQGCEICKLFLETKQKE